LPCITITFSVRRDLTPFGGVGYFYIEVEKKINGYGFFLITIGIEANAFFVQDVCLNFLV
jgi:hypothetical protein